MCGRFSLIKQQLELEHYFQKDMPAGYRGPNYNVAPTQNVPVITKEGFEIMRWGLVPQWAKSMSSGYNMINAVGETLSEKPTYKGLLKNQRCIIPASGFFEWLQTESGKVPYYFHLKSREVFGFAGLFTTKKDSEGVVMKSFTIITTAPNELVKPVHNRMPVILVQEDESVWLDPENIDLSELQAMLVPFDSNDMVKFEVSKDVGSTRNNSPELVEPVR